MTYTVRVERQLIEWVDLAVNAKTPEEAERRAKREALKATGWQRVQNARPFKARVIVQPSAEERDAAKAKTVILATEKKLREAIFFLDHLREQGHRVPSDPEHFDFFLGAFLAAARSVTFTLQFEEKAKYDVWFPLWWQKQKPEDQKLLGFLKDQRNDTQKKGAAATSSAWDMIPITELGFGSQNFYWSTPPGVELPRVGVRVHSFSSGENELEVVQTCERYMILLKQLVNEFQVAHP